MTSAVLVTSEPTLAIGRGPSGAAGAADGAVAGAVAGAAGQCEEQCEELANEGEREALASLLELLKPWKKGPLRLFGVDIDTEWRSDWKWDRLAPHVPPLRGKAVLDLGCANGYFMFRMLEQGPRAVVGVDPNVKAWLEFTALKRFAGDRARALHFEVCTPLARTSLDRSRRSPACATVGGLGDGQPNGGSLSCGRRLTPGPPWHDFS